MKQKYKLTIAWLYPDLMNTYGDRGNIIVLTKRAQRRGIEVTVEQITVDSSESLLNNADLFFMGGAQDTQQEIVTKDLMGKKGNVLKTKVMEGVPGLYICGAYQFLGKYYKTADGKILNGLNIFPLHTTNPGLSEKRLIGNIIIKPTLDVLSQDIIGFENHGGRTHLENSTTPLGDVIIGHGNNATDKTEGIIFEKSIGTYMHGPILPKNPELADLLLTWALEKKYSEKFHLEPIDDKLEENARQIVINRLK